MIAELVGLAFAVTTLDEVPESAIAEWWSNLMNTRSEELIEWMQSSEARLSENQAQLQESLKRILDKVFTNSVQQVEIRDWLLEIQRRVDESIQQQGELKEALDEIRQQEEAHSQFRSNTFESINLLQGGLGEASLIQAETLKRVDLLKDNVGQSIHRQGQLMNGTLAEQSQLMNRTLEDLSTSLGVRLAQEQEAFMESNRTLLIAICSVGGLGCLLFLCFLLVQSSSMRTMTELTLKVQSQALIEAGRSSSHEAGVVVLDDPPGASPQVDRSNQQFRDSMASLERRLDALGRSLEQADIDPASVTDFVKDSDTRPRSKAGSQDYSVS